VILLAFGALAGCLTRLLPGVQATATAIGLGIGVVALAQWMFIRHSVLVPLAVPLLIQLPVAMFAGLLSRYRDIRKQMPIEVNPYARQQLFSGVCLTTDVKGYTHLAEHLTRDELHDLLNEYHEMLRGLVAARRGLVWAAAATARSVSGEHRLRSGLHARSRDGWGGRGSRRRRHD